MKRERLGGYRPVLAIGLCLALFTACSAAAGSPTGPGGNKKTSPGQSITAPVTVPRVSQATTTSGPDEPAGTAALPDAAFCLTISGDVLSHANHLRAARQEDGSYDYGPQFEEVKGLLSAGDLTLVNLETTVAGAAFGYRGFPRFNAPLNMAQTLKDSGVDLVITANNHILDNGFKGLTGNLDNLDKVGLLHTGAARTKEEAQTPFILDINGIRTGFAASTIKLSMSVEPDFAVPLNRETTIRRKIRALRAAGAELIVFHIHWGREYEEMPSDNSKALYRILEDEGVDIVIGSHPHRLQPFELRRIDYKGTQKNTAVIWSTANLSWAEPINKDYVNTGAVFTIGVTRENGQVEVRQLDYELVYNLTTKTVDGTRYTKIIPESAMADYRASHPAQYADMLEEFTWAHQVLNRTVNLD